MDTVNDRGRIIMILILDFSTTVSPLPLHACLLSIKFMIVGEMKSKTREREPFPFHARIPTSDKIP